MKYLAFILVISLGLGLAYSILRSAEERVTVFLTGYSYWDNTPPASAEIGRKFLHDVADGIGTYDDPVTMAVGWQIRGGKSFEDIEPGTRFYIPRLRRYAIVEDLCGDGPTPQDGPCHIGWKGYTWLDIYVDGSAADAETANDCMEKLTGIQMVIRNPHPGYPVWQGRIVESGCDVFEG